MSGGAGRLILLRHGESVANANGLFTGSLDVPLTPYGIQESRHAAALIAVAGLGVGSIFTSELRRARTSATVAAAVLNVDLEDVQPDWRLNERSYGILTGRSKAEVLHRYGQEKFTRWRRRVDTEPPPMSEMLHRRLASTEPFDRLPAEALPYTESLRHVIARVVAFYEEAAHPLLASGATVLLVAHGNSLRALCAHLDTLTAPEISALNIPTGQPLVYELDDTLQPTVRGGQYLDEKAALEAAAEVSAQGGT